MKKERCEDIHDYIDELIKINNELHEKLVESEKKREIGKRNFKAFIAWSKKRGTKILGLEKEVIRLRAESVSDTKDKLIKEVNTLKSYARDIGYTLMNEVDRKTELVKKLKISENKLRVTSEKLLKANMEYKEQVTQINRLIKKNEEVNSRNEKLKAFIIITSLISILYWMW